MKYPKVNTPAAPGAERGRKALESTATFGLLLLAIGLVAPFTNLQNDTMLSAFKWIFGSGALIYTASRIAGVFGPAGSMRLRRLRRMEVWAGIAFCAATFFWFYNVAHVGYLTMKVMRDTVVFTLAGALIQIIASWLTASERQKLAAASHDAGKDDKTAR